MASPKKSVAAPKTSTVEGARDGAAAALPPPDDEEGGGAGGEKKVTIADGEEGTPSAEEKWIIGEFNCSCVGPVCISDEACSTQYEDLSFAGRAC